MTTSRPEVIAFLQAIKEQPDDDTPRLILADWLEERGDPRGEVLRLQVTLARLIPGTKAWWDRHEREQALRKLHEKDWLGPLARLTDSYTLYRGLVQLTMEMEHFLGSKVAALAKTETFAWVDGARLTQFDPTATEIGRLAGSSLLAGLNALNLGAQRIDVAGAVLLADSPHLANLTALELYENPIGPEGAAALAGAPHLAGLTSLNLDGCRIEDAGASRLAAGTRWTRLATLQLRGNQIGDAGAAALAGTPRFASLRGLHLTNNRIGDTGARALAGSPHLGDLEALDLQHNPISPDAAAALRQRFGSRVSV
jgi:uncharacterized protein (TIGR02996 family)